MLPHMFSAATTWSLRSPWRSSVRVPEVAQPAPEQQRHAEREGWQGAAHGRTLNETDSHYNFRDHFALRVAATGSTMPMWLNVTLPPRRGWA